MPSLCPHRPDELMSILQDPACSSPQENIPAKLDRVGSPPSGSSNTPLLILRFLIPTLVTLPVCEGKGQVSTEPNLHLQKAQSCAKGEW